MAPYALRFGDLVHQALAAYYVPGTKRGPAPAATFERLYHEQARRHADDGFDVYADDKWMDALDLGRGMLTGYVERFEEDDANYEVVSSEQTFKVKLLVPETRFSFYQDGRLDPVADVLLEPAFRFWMAGTFDGVWRHVRTGDYIFKEFKTASALSHDGLSLDEQASVYHTYGPKWLARRRLLPPGARLKAIVYTFLRKAIPDPDAVYNADGLVLNKPSKEALEAAWTEVQMDRAANDTNDLHAWDGLYPPRLDGKSGKPRAEDYAAALREAGVDPEQLGEPSKVQPKPYFSRVPVYRDDADRRIQHERILTEARNIKRARDDSPLQTIIKNPGPLHMPNCRGCPVRDACEVHEAGGDWQSVYNATTIKWDPYSQHNLPERV